MEETMTLDIDEVIYASKHCYRCGGSGKTLALSKPGELKFKTCDVCKGSGEAKRTKHWSWG